MDPRARLVVAVHRAMLDSFRDYEHGVVPTAAHADAMLAALDPAILSALLDGLALGELPRSGEEAIWLTRDIRGRWETQVVYPLSGRPKLASMFTDTIHEAIASMGEDGS